MIPWKRVRKARARRRIQKDLRKTPTFLMSFRRDRSTAKQFLPNHVNFADNYDSISCNYRLSHQRL